jgi:hypothetical protein
MNFRDLLSVGLALTAIFIGIRVGRAVATSVGAKVAS